MTHNQEDAGANPVRATKHTRRAKYPAATIGMTPSEKQDYYGSYAYSGWFYHEPPRLDRDFLRAFEEIGGTDEWGEPRYRLVWGGVGLVRKSEDESERGIIRGDERAVITTHGIQQVKYFEGKTRYPNWWHYKIRKGKKFEDRKLKRHEDIPKNATSIFAEYEYMWLGKMRWFIETKLSAEQLVHCGYRDSFDKSIPPKGDYISILMIETPDGKYYEPDRRYLDYLRVHFFDANNRTVSELLASDKAERALSRADKAQREEEEEEKEFYSVLDKLLNAPKGRVYSIPT